jgi:TM2 domain-containing membrane protein YozV
METTAFIDIRFEQIFGTSTISFRNTKISTYLIVTSFISLVGTGAALFFLSGGGENITARDVSWSLITWLIGAYLHLPVLLWLRASGGDKCQYCQERPPEKGKFCRVCNGRYGLSNAYDAAKEEIKKHIREQYEQGQSERGLGPAPIPAD